jgi:hypothetical protein
MAITFNDNISISAQKPVDNRFGPFANTSAALAAIPAGQRYIGLTVGIGTNPVVEYWFNDGILDGDFVAKTASGNLTGITAGSGIAVSGSATNPTVAIDPVVVQTTANLSTNIITDASNAVKYPNVPAVKTYVDSFLVSVINDRGNFIPSSTSPGIYPSTGGSGTAGAIMKGDLWFINFAPGQTTGYLGTSSVQIGTSVRALVDSPSPTTATDWDILDAGLGYIPEDSANRVLDGTGITSDPTSPTKYPSVKALTEYLTTFTPSVPTLQQVVSSAVGANISTDTNIIVQNTAVTKYSTVNPGEIALFDFGTSRSVYLGTNDRISVQVGTNYTTYEATRITFNGSGYTSTLQAQPGNQIMYLPSPPSAFKTLALSVNGNFADSSGEITLPSSVGSGTPFKLTMWDSPSGTAIVDSDITNNGSNTSIGIFNDGTKLSAGKYGVQIGIGYPLNMSYPYETLVVSDATSNAGVGVYCTGNTPGSSSSSIFLGNEEYTTGAGYYISHQATFVNSTSALLSIVTNNFLYRDLAGSVLEAVTDILKIWGDGTVSLQASGTGSLNTAYPRLIINADPSTLSLASAIKLYVDGEVSVPNGVVDAAGFSSPNLAGVGNGLIIASAVGALSRTTLPTGTLNRIPKWTATGSLSLGNSQIFDDGTYVGIGTITPTEKLQVNGNLLLGEIGVPADNDSYSIKLQGKGTTGIAQTGEIKIDASGTAATQGCFQMSTNGFIRFSAATGSFEFKNTAGSAVTLRNDTGGVTLQAFSTSAGITLRNNTSQTSGKLLSVVNASLNEPLTILANGNVGINNANPQRSLHINDVMRLDPRATAPSSPSAGDIYYSSADNTLKFYNGTTWRTIAGV